MLIDQVSTAGVPAPVWFVQFFKALGFTLHAVPMNLWYAGLLVALLLHVVGNEHARRFAARLLGQMPVIVAVGVNLGIVPLLFVQLAYYKVFYPATILMAWFWLAIIGLLIPAYYGVYAYAWGIRGGDGMARWRTAAGWISALFFLCIGFLFANGLSLMEHVARWPELWTAHSTSGAALGTALNVGDPTLWPRWLLMFGLALGTTAAWAVFDAEWLQGLWHSRPRLGAEKGTGPICAQHPEGRSGKLDLSPFPPPDTAEGGCATETANDSYRRWTWGFARKLYTVSLLWAAAAGAWYVFGTWPAELRQTMLQWPLWPLTLVTAAATGLPWLLLMIAGRGGKGDRSNLCDDQRCASVSASGPFRQIGPVPFSAVAFHRTTAAAIALCQFGVLGVNAVSRQVVQNINLKPSFDVLAQPTDVQWGPLWMFLIVFVIGLGVVAWMLAQVKKCKSSSPLPPGEG